MHCLVPVCLCAGGVPRLSALPSDFINPQYDYQAYWDEDIGDGTALYKYWRLASNAKQYWAAWNTEAGECGEVWRQAWTNDNTEGAPSSPLPRIVYIVLGNTRCTENVALGGGGCMTVEEFGDSLVQVDIQGNEGDTDIRGNEARLPAGQTEGPQQGAGALVSDLMPECIQLIAGCKRVAKPENRAESSVALRARFITSRGALKAVKTAHPAIADVHVLLCCPMQLARRVLDMRVVLKERAVLTENKATGSGVSCV